MIAQALLLSLVIALTAVTEGCGPGSGASPDLAPDPSPDLALDLALDLLQTPDAPPDGDVCDPACGTRECGDDACGSTCGLCPLGETCTEGLCVPAGYAHVVVNTLVSSVGPGPDVTQGTGFFDSMIQVPTRFVVLVQPQPDPPDHTQMLDSTRCTYLRFIAGKSRITSGGTAVHQDFLDGIVGRNVSVSYCISPVPSAKSSESLSFRTVDDPDEQSIECTFHGGIVPLSTDPEGFPIPIPLDGASGQVDWRRHGPGTVWGLPAEVVTDIATGAGLLGLRDCAECLAP